MDPPSPHAKDGILPQGSAVAGYTLGRPVGRGSFGTVYEAVHDRLGRRVALKVLHERHPPGSPAALRFLREARAAARVEHPHVVSVLDLGEDRGLLWLAMERLEGETLAARLERQGPLALDELVSLMLPVCSAVAAMHAAGVVHRDLKPSNLFLARTRPGAVRPVVLDLGVAHMFEASAPAITVEGALLGTPQYMAPEQTRRAAAPDARSDQWALGVILYECATGHRPFEGHSLPEVLDRVRSEDPPPPSALRPGLPAGFDRVVLAAMARAPSRRFASVRELGAALLCWAPPATRALWRDDLGAASSPAPPVAPPVDPLAETLATAPRRRRLWLAPSGVALAAALAAAGWYTRRPGPPRVESSPAPSGRPPPRGAAVAGEAQQSCPDPQEHGCGVVALPGGVSTLGQAGARNATPEQPGVRVSPFAIDRFEVTVGRFRRYWQGAGHPTPASREVPYPGGRSVTLAGEVTEPTEDAVNATCTWSRVTATPTRDDHPINCVDWATAMAFCVWDGGRLPTEAEWEFAARGVEGRDYAWREGGPDARKVNTCDRECASRFSRQAQLTDSDGWSATSRVGAFPAGATPEGVLDLIGNVSEWTADWYTDYTASGWCGGVSRVDPVCAAATSSARSLRGGAWSSTELAWYRAASRSMYGAPRSRYDFIGFRCARSPTAGRGGSP